MDSTVGKKLQRVYFFGVGGHTFEDIGSAVPDFLEAIRGKKVLYAEIRPKFIAQLADLSLAEAKDWVGRGLVPPDCWLVKIAMDKGLKVIPLDSGKFDYSQPKSQPLNEELFQYQNKVKRERRWEEILRGAPLHSIALMHSEHALELMKRLGVPRGHSFCQLFYSTGKLRKAAEEQADAIAQARLKRKIARAQARAKGTILKKALKRG